MKQFSLKKISNYHLYVCLFSGLILLLVAGSPSGGQAFINRTVSANRLTSSAIAPALEAGSGFRIDRESSSLDLRSESKHLCGEANDKPFSAFQEPSSLRPLAVVPQRRPDWFHGGQAMVPRKI